MPFWKEERGQRREDRKIVEMNGEWRGAETVNHLAENTRFKGEIEAQSNLRIDGEFEGKIKCAGKVVVGESGKVAGEVECQSAEIGGEAKVTIKVNELLELKSTSRFTGEIIAKQISVEPGCTITNTRINFLSEQTAQKQALFESSAIATEREEE